MQKFGLAFDHSDGVGLLAAFTACTNTCLLLRIYDFMNPTNAEQMYIRSILVLDVLYWYISIVCDSIFSHVKCSFFFTSLLFLVHNFLTFIFLD